MAWVAACTAGACAWDSKPTFAVDLSVLNGAISRQTEGALPLSVTTLPQGSCVNSPGIDDATLLGTGCVGTAAFGQAFPLCAGLDYTAEWESLKVMVCCLLSQFWDTGTFATVVELATPFAPSGR